MFANTGLLLIITPKRCWHLRPASECRLRGHIWTYWADFQRPGQIISWRSRFWHQIRNKMWFSCPFVKIMAFRVETKTGGHMARIARNDLIFNAFCREQRGEADFGLRLYFCIFLALCNKNAKKTKATVSDWIKRPSGSILFVPW